MHPITELTVTEQMGVHGFPESARLKVVAEGGPGDLHITVVPLAFGPVLLRNDDGRTSRFPRAMVRYEADDGRQGLGWIEWNQPEPA